ncbi:MAG: PH domain-containing protein [Planctomycetota bacterium]|jgi:hypothetical protein
MSQPPELPPKNQQHVWYYRRQGFLDYVEEGPFSESQLLELAKSGKLKLDTHLKSPTRTKGQWYEAQSFKPLTAAINEAKVESGRRKLAEKEEKLKQKPTKPKEQEGNGQEDTEAQRATAIDRIKTQVQGILTKNEFVTFAVLQAKPIVIKADAAVCTNRRLIIYRPKLLGRFEFQDYLWRDLSDVHIEQGILASTFFARHISGRSVVLDWLPKQGAQELYRLTQEAEEDAFHVRRKMQLEEAEAGAAKINLAANTSPAQSPPAQDDVLARLQKLKQLLDAQLITAAEFEEKKAAILRDI